MFSILSLGNSYHLTKKAIGTIISNVAASIASEMWKEDILTFMVRRDFQITSLGALQFGFFYCTKVSVETTFCDVFSQHFSSF